MTPYVSNTCPAYPPNVGSKAAGRKSAAELVRIYKLVAKLHDTSQGRATLKEYCDWTGGQRRSVRRWLKKLGIVVPGAPPDPAEEPETSGETEGPDAPPPELRSSPESAPSDPASTPSLLEEAAAEKNEIVIPVTPGAPPPPARDPLTVSNAQQVARMDARIRAIEQRAPAGRSAETGRSVGSDYTAEGRRNVAEEIAKAHTGLMEDLAVDADAFITATGGIVWRRWQESGYRTEFPDPKTGPVDFVTEAINFFSEYRLQVADLYNQMDDLKDENERLRATIAGLTDTRRAMDRIFETFMILKLRGVFVTREEVSIIADLLRPPQLEEQGA